MAAETWVIVLAAGDGTRLRAVATDARGASTPKQFLTFGRGRSLLRTTLDRARAIAPPERVVTVAASSHERWWRREMDVAGLGNVLAQPCNAGTAAGLLLPLLAVLQRDPDALVLVLPSDHHAEDEAGFVAALQELVAGAGSDRSRVMLLGMEPDGPEVEYGWIVPSPPSHGPGRGVHAFVEKPLPAEAATLLVRGALWSTFVMAASARSLLGLFRRATPALAARFLAEAARNARFAWQPERLRGLYDGLESTDFSKAVLQHPACRDALRVLPAAACGWTDLGTPERVVRAFGFQALATAAARAASSDLPADARQGILQEAHT